jgi:hypothetical protein
VRLGQRPTELGSRPEWGAALVAAPQDTTGVNNRLIFAT